MTSARNGLEFGVVDFLPLDPRVVFVVNALLVQRREFGLESAEPVDGHRHAAGRKQLGECLPSAHRAEALDLPREELVGDGVDGILQLVDDVAALGHGWRVAAAAEVADAG